MKRVMFWSHFKHYSECPQRYLWRKGWPGVDVGAGLGRPRPIPLEDLRCEHHAVMGKAIQAVLERFYNEEVWQNPEVWRDGGMTRWLAEQALEELKLALANATYIDWKKAPSIPELERICVDGAVGYLSTMKAHRLLGAGARSEVKVIGYLDEQTPIGGFIDFVISRKTEEGTSELMLLDGKNSKHKDRYLSPDQLKFYAICFKLKHGTLPDRLGWVWFRYPHGLRQDDGTVETGIQWIEFDEEDLRSLAFDILEVRKGMEARRFPATPSPKICRFCDYEPQCAARQLQRRENAAKRNASRKVSDDKFRKELASKGTDFDGILDFGF